MARGIIVAKPAGGTTAGRILITDTSSSATSSTGTATSGTTSATPALTLGSYVSFNEDTTAKVSDIVDFTFDATGAAAKLTLVKSGTIVTGTYTDNIVVAAGQAVLINGAANFDGKITVNGGILIVIENTHAEGKIESASPGSFVMIDGCTIEGKVEVTGTGTMIIQNTTVEGKISSNGNIYASVTGSTIKGKIEILNATSCFNSGNTIAGESNTPNCKA